MFKFSLAFSKKASDLAMGHGSTGTEGKAIIGHTYVVLTGPFSGPIILKVRMLMKLHIHMGHSRRWKCLKAQKACAKRQLVQVD